MYYQANIIFLDKDSRKFSIVLFLLQAHHIRLRGGFRFSEGRIEVFHDSVWGTICDDNWDLVDANVACRQAGFGTAFEAVRDAAIGAGTGRVSRFSCKLFLQ